MSRIKPFKLVIGSTQSPEINKIATNNYDQENTIEYEGNNNYMINAAQKRKSLSKNALDKNKISPSNKSIVKAIRDKRRREITNDIEDMDLSNNNITHEESNTRAHLISKPKAFSGRRNELPAFLGQINQYFKYNLDEEAAADDEFKIDIISSYLEGNAAEWFVDLVKEKSPPLENYENFIDALQQR